MKAEVGGERRTVSSRQRGKKIAAEVKALVISHWLSVIGHW
jgi:hypothetical protein